MRIHRADYRAFFFSLLTLLSFQVGAASAQMTKLKVSYSSITANNSPVWLAKEKGLFSKHRLDTQVLLIESGTTSIQALVAGETQIAQLGGGVILSSGLAGADVVSIAGLENRSAFSLITQKEIKSAEQLKGKRLAISRFGSASDLAARLILQRLGLVPDKDVTILQVGGTSTRLAAITKGSVEAAVITPEFYILAKKAGVTTLADPLSVKIDFPQNAIATSRSFLKSQPETVAQYLKAILEGIHYFKSNRDESMRIMGRYLKIEDREALAEIYELYRNVLAPIPYSTVEGMQMLLGWMGQRDPRAREARAEQFIDSTSLREIEKSGFISSLYQK
ncbi:MAG: ABC transporter substrate-binding protein [Deltaproteobacteria bacterium]|nr:ABC transporter substrate-binding protein [Deltaproteobacteria bacterium]